MDEPVPPNGVWMMIDAVNGARRMIMRLRTDRPDEPDIDTYSTAVTIGWDYPEREGTPKPPDEIYQQMLGFEKALDELSFDNGHAFLMYVCTGLGTREMCYYVKDRERFMQRFNQLLARHPRYPLEIKFYDDPDWKVWLQMRHAYERTGGEPAPIASRPSQSPATIASKVRGWLNRYWRN